MAVSRCEKAARICFISESLAAADSSASSWALSGRLASLISSARASDHEACSAGWIETLAREKSRTFLITQDKNMRENKFDTRACSGRGRERAAAYICDSTSANMQEWGVSKAFGIEGRRGGAGAQKRRGSRVLTNAAHKHTGAGSVGNQWLYCGVLHKGLGRNAAKERRLTKDRLVKPKTHACRRG